MTGSVVGAIDSTKENALSILPKQLRTQEVGSIYGHVFENHIMGIARQLFWSVTLNCDPVRWNNEDWNCSFTTEWFVLPVAHWSDLDGITLSDVRNGQSIESSLYLGDHHPATLDAISLTRITGTRRFLVNIEAKVDIGGFDDLGGVGIPISLHGEAVFTGLVVVPENLHPKPDTPQKAVEALSAFISLSELREPEWQEFRYVFQPV